mmetsp:Transcript_1853/g.6443  ORF Transcript_1853/g.6443 Transcript_1853/m.6443 type:complete len:178 (+) Transcript_1853:172-705(+)
MEEAWQAHIRKLTLQQLLSPEECRAHLDSFARSVVSQGLAHTPLASNDLVQDVISTFLRAPEYVMPPAASMRVITNMQRELHIGAMLKEIREIVKKAALEGRDKTRRLDARERSSGIDARGIDARKLQSSRSFTTDEIWLEKLFTVLRQEGYDVEEETAYNSQHNSQVKTGIFSLSW